MKEIYTKSAVYFGDLASNVDKSIELEYSENGIDKVIDCTSKKRKSILNVSELNTWAQELGATETYDNIHDAVTYIKAHASSSMYYIEYTATAKVTPAEGADFGAVYVDASSTFDSSTQKGKLAFQTAPTKIGSLAFSGNTDLLTIIIPEGITQIIDHAFYQCENLNKVVFPSSLTIIDNYAFLETNLSKIDLPDGVVSIGASAFANNENVTSIVIPSSLTNLGTFGFSGCFKSTNIFIPNTITILPEAVFGYNFRDSSATVNSVAIGNAVTIIGDRCFEENTYLKTIFMPSSVTTIGQRAFINCSNLSEIFYTGTMALWNAITKNTYWHRSCPTITVFCTDGNVTVSPE